MKKVALNILFLLILTSFTNLNAQWARLYGGNADDLALSVQPTSDGGYIAAGFTESFGSGDYDAWILKLSSTGDVEWQRIYGGIYNDRLYSVQQTNDGGYIAAGFCSPSGIDWNVWVLKLSSNGDIEWQRYYGVSGENWAYSIQQTNDGGYIVAASTYAFWGGIFDIWILKLSSNGSIEWQRIYGGDDEDYVYSIQETNDSGYIVGGVTSSFGAGDYDAWILKLSSEGDVEWHRTYGGERDDFGFNISFNFPGNPTFQQTNDGGTIAAGYTASLGTGGYDAWVFKLSSNGDIEWQRTYGGEGNDWAYSVHQTSDGGYVAAGETYSPSHSFWIIKLSSVGDIEWQRTYTGSIAHAVQETSDGGYVAAGEKSYDFGAGLRDFFILKLSSDGDIPPVCGLIGISDASVTNTNISPEVSIVINLGWTNISPSTPDFVVQDTDATVTSLCPGYTLTISPSLGGITDPIPGSYPFGTGTKVQIEAIPEPDYRFSEWTGDVPEGEEDDNPLSIFMYSDKSIRANFILQRVLTIAAGSGGTTDPSPGTYTHDFEEQVSVLALASSGYEFSNWSGDASGTDNPITFLMDFDKSITANFSLVEQEEEVLNGKMGSCFIATAAYGSSLHPHVVILQDFKDKYLMPNTLGRALVKLYYNYSPFVVDIIMPSKPLKAIVRIHLIPIVIFSYSMIYLGPICTGSILLFFFVLPIFFRISYRRK